MCSSLCHMGRSHYTRFISILWWNGMCGEALEFGWDSCLVTQLYLRWKSPDPPPPRRLYSLMWFRRRKLNTSSSIGCTSCVDTELILCKHDPRPEGIVLMYIHVQVMTRIDGPTCPFYWWFTVGFFLYSCTDVLGFYTCTEDYMECNMYVGS